jgi:NAD(P)-dependent dehydrogenase (short-subunit alcohol dehydrogenase family)
MTTVKKNAVVTGAASGIGKATAIAFVNKGHHVFGLDIDTVGGVNIESEINHLQRIIHFQGLGDPFSTLITNHLVP